jgi:ABC-type dipeptide/oligopeptide/nickel transport system permease subunit
MTVNLGAALAGGGLLAAIILLGSAPATDLGTASELQLRLLARTAVPTLVLISVAAILRTFLGLGLGLLRVSTRATGLLGALLTLPSVVPEVIVGFVAFWAIFAPQSPTAWLVALTIPGALHVAIDMRARARALLVRPWIESAIAVGSDRRGLLVRHLLPNLGPTLPTLFATQAAASVVLLGELVLVNAYIGQSASLITIQLSALQANYLPTWGMALPPALRAITQGDLQTVFIPVVAFAALLTLLNGFAALSRSSEITRGHA